MILIFQFVSFFFLLANDGCLKNPDFDKSNPPPGTVWVQENYFLDRNELANIDYWEYQYWIAKVFGKTSEQYQATLLDSTVIENDFGFKSDYFTNRIYDGHPVVGISWEQAVNYSNWRTDRVLEMQLISKGSIKIHTDQNTGNYFTLRKYFNGDYMGYEPVAEIDVAVYGLPTKEEWEAMFPSVVRVYDLSQKYFHLNKSGKKEVKGVRISGLKKSKKILVNDLYGNVAEITATKGLAKGGSWKNTMDECSPSKSFVYTSPTNWLGVRYKCEIVKMKGRK